MSLGRLFTILSAERSAWLAESGRETGERPFGGWWDVTGPERLLDPTGGNDQATDTTLAPRLRSLRGLTAGLLDNTKPNASVLLSEVASRLQREHGLRTSVMYAKGYFGTPVEESQIQQILRNCDFAVAGIGD
jgi:hypothetical protein